MFISWVLELSLFDVVFVFGCLEDFGEWMYDCGSVEIEVEVLRVEDFWCVFV